ncbi:MAG TPA: alkaline phosphatase D family protein [Burkholderiales bacterium]|nr:alkaline phosphatase D family protein [Burkholderiales bacterium]
MTITRRRFLQCSAGLLASAYAGRARRVLAQPRFAAYPYTLGVASGYPRADGVTLWTRLAPEPLLGGGMLPASVPVRWEVAADETFANVVAQGAALAEAEWAHTVHVDVNGLAPARPYWYRFRAGDALSPAGRTRTAPEASAMPAPVRFAFASCQQYEQGYYTAYRHMAREELDLVIHLGDYIYESSWGRAHVRKHGALEPYTLDEYRNRYALYKSDPDLQAAHAAFPWLVTWDDHEVDNDYANDRSQDLDPPDVFLARRAAAYRAYYEHMPLPAWARPRGHDMQLYHTAAYGPLARFYVLDTRQYRSHQVCPRPERGGSNVVPETDCAGRLDPKLTMLGRTQERWLHASLGRSSSHWNVIAQQTMMAQVDRRPGPGADYWTDGWDGYPRARERLLEAVTGHRVSNPVVLGGDVHTAAVADLKVDFNDAHSAVVATEFICPSISSQGPSPKRVELLLQENPHVSFANGTRRGYTTLELTHARCIARIRTIGSAAEPDSPIRTLATYAVQNGRPGAQSA